MEYALMALKCLSGKGPSAPQSARQICNDHQIPFDTTAKVLKILHAHGIVKSIQGHKGGYFLDVDLSSISFYHLAKIVDEKVEIIACSEIGVGCHKESNCTIVNPMRYLDQIFMNFLKSLTVLEVLSEDPGQRPVQSLISQLNEIKV